MLVKLALRMTEEEANHWSLVIRHSSFVIFPMIPAPPPASPNWVSLLLQTSDALFPTGAYAHSLGFEEIVQLGLAHDEETLRQFLDQQAAPALAHFDLPYLRYAFDSAQANNLTTLAALDAEVRAAKLARETRDASARLGARRLKALRVLLPHDPKLSACADAVRTGRMDGHHVIICGVQAAVAGIPLEAALTAYFYQSIAAIGSAALKLIRIGQDGVQRAVYAANVGAEDAVRISFDIAREDAGWFSPLLEIASMRHEHAHERLFIS